MTSQVDVNLRADFVHNTCFEFCGLKFLAPFRREFAWFLIEVFPTEGPSYPIISHTTILFTLTTDKQKKFT